MADLIGHDRQPSAFIVYLFLTCASVAARERVARSGAGRRGPASDEPGMGGAHLRMPLQDIAERTGLSKRSVQSALGWLVKRKLIAIARESITAIPVYTVMRPWKR